MRGRRRRWLVSLLALVIAAPAIDASAFWNASGTGAASVGSASLVAATISVPGSATNSLTVTWTQQAALPTAPAGSSAITYAVERRLGAGSYAAVSSGGCSGTKAQATASCVDAPAASGSYTYRVIASLASWTATSSAAGPVTVLVDTTAPTVTSIARAGASPTNLASVSWTVTFSEAVTGVSAADFALARTGVTGGAISAVTGSGTTYTVTSTSGTGDGTLGLNLADDDSIVDVVSLPLGGAGAGNGSLTGQAYTIDKTAPTAPTALAVPNAVVWSSPPTCAGVTSGTRYINATATSASASTVAITATVAEAGLTVVVSATSAATNVTASVAAPTTAVATTQNLGTLADGTITLTASATDAAGNTSPTSTLGGVLVKDTVIPTLTAVFHSLGGGGLGLGPHVDGTTSDCGALITAEKRPTPGLIFTATSTGTAPASYDIDPVNGVLVLGLVSYSVTATDRAGNVSVPVIT
jgi:hypothetical protein